MDYQKLGLKVGFEIHQQLDTGKLFCRCPSRIVKDRKPDLVIKRLFRAVPGELREIDIAALFEETRAREVIYYCWDEVDCLVDIDEEPPHEADKDALLEALRIALAMHCEIPEILCVMRKTIVDGSVPSGFQRTILIGMNGWIEVNGKKIPIGTICLEEDSGRKIKEEGERVYFALDRLGIPLVEIRTDPVIQDPEEARKVAEYIGLFLRSFRVKRGIGTIRQDVNVSIEGGARVEIKGVQDLGLIPKIVEYEVIRQLSLLKLKNGLLQRGLTKEEIRKEEIKDITSLLQKWEDKFSKRLLKEGKILAIKVPKFRGLFNFEIQPGKRFGRELADIVVAFGLKGLIHSDEAEKYFAPEKVKEIKEKLFCSDQDGFILIAGPEERVKRCFLILKERLCQCLEGVPKEVRKANPDGTTTFLRPLPGAARMYPETDLPPIDPAELIEIAKVSIPEPIFEKIKRMASEYGVREEIIKALISKDREGVFEELVSISGEDPNLIAQLLLSIDTLVKKDFGKFEFDEKIFIKTFSLFSAGKISKDNFYKAYWMLINGKSEDEVIKELGKIPLEKIKGEIEELIKKYGKDQINKIIGELIRKYGKRIDGREIFKYIGSLK